MRIRACTGGLGASFVLACAALSASPSPDDLAVTARRGREAMAAGRFDEAAALYAEITRALPDEPGMLLNLGMALCTSPVDSLQFYP